MSRAIATQTVRARVDQLVARVRWFDASGQPLPSPKAHEELLDDEGSQIKDAIIRWLEKGQKKK